MLKSKGLYVQPPPFNKYIPYNRGDFSLLKSITMSDKLKLFQYAVILHKYTQTKENNGKIYDGAEMIVELSTILAKNEKEVVFKATRLIPEDKASSPDDVEILVRPF